MSLLYHLAEPDPWQRAEAAGHYLPDAFAKEGFIHCCHPHQLSGVVKRYYSHRHDLVLLELDPQTLGAALVEENLLGGAELFPHLYGPIPLTAVRRTTPFNATNPPAHLAGLFSESTGAQAQNRSPAMFDADLFLKQRGLLLKTVHGLDAEAMNTITARRSNNIAWNLGHILIVQQMLTYGLSGLPLPLPEDWVARFARDTSPADWDGPAEVEEITSQVLSSAERFLEDLPTLREATFRPYTTATGLSIPSLNDAILFNSFHEGVHVGIMLSIRKELEA